MIFDFGHFFIHLGVDSKIALFEIVLKVHCCKVHEINGSWVRGEKRQPEMWYNDLFSRVPYVHVSAN